MKNVLLIEPNPMIAYTTRRFFESLHCCVNVVSSGLAALEKLHQAYRLVVVNLNLSDLSGLEIARHLRQSKGPNSKTPIVIVTTHEDVQQKVQAYELGVKGFLLKPLTKELCRQMIDDLVLSAAAPHYFLEG